MEGEEVMDQSLENMDENMRAYYIQLREEKRYRAILEDIMTRAKSYDDWKDESRQPSYTNLKVPYHMICRKRYAQKMQEYEDSFNHEFKLMIDYQPSAFDATLLTRHLAITTLWPPLHNRKEIKYFHESFFRLRRKQQMRLEYLLNTKVE